MPSNRVEVLPPTRTSRPGLRVAVSSLRGNRPFQLLWLSNLFFFGGVWTQTLVLGWLAFTLTHSEFLVAIFTAVRLSPMLLGPIAGALADRYHRVRLLIIACCWAIAAVTVLSVLASAELLSYTALLVGGLAIGLAQSPSQPARASLVLELVGRRNLSGANALNAMAMNMTQVIGPAVGGAMIATLGAATALWISVAWYAISLLLILPLRSYGHVLATTGHSVLSMISSGLRIVSRNRIAVSVLLVTLAANTLLWPIFQSFMPVFASESLGLGAAGLGGLLTCCGIGGLIGSLIIAGLGDFRFKGALFVGGTAAWAAAWSAFALTHRVGLAFVLMALIGLGSAAFGVLQTTLLLMATEPEVHGRALGLQELAIGIMPLAAVFLGLIAEQVGVGPTTFVAGVLLIVALAILAVTVPELPRFSGDDG